MATPAARPETSTLGPYIAVDGHVHLHPGQDLRALLDIAAANLARRSREGGLPADAGCLLLAESCGVDGFGRLAGWRDPAGTSGWTVVPTDEAVSLVARRPGMLPLIVVAGRQIVTAEHIEVLALGRREEYPDGRPLAATLDDLESGALLTVLPWGWGKWWFGRGRMIAALLQARAGSLWLGDNGGRLALAPEPRHFRSARRLGIPILPGSDPLALPGGVQTVGRYGFVVHCPLDRRYPARSLLDYLRSNRKQPHSFGELAGPARFLVSQLRMQWRKTRRR